MRYRISFNAPSKIIMSVLAAGPRQSWVDVSPDEVRGRVGWAGAVTIRREDITSVNRPEQTPWWLGFGVHGLFGTWGLNGSYSGMVKITMKQPARGRVMFFPIKPHTVYFSLEQPEEFIHELTTASDAGA